MPSRASHHDAVARRLELLTAELAAVREPDPEPGPGWTTGPAPPPPDEHTHVRPARVPAPPWPDPQTSEPPDEPPPPRPVPVPGRHAARRVPVAGTWSALHGRVALGPGQLAVVAVLVAVGLALTAWWVLRTGGGEVATPVAGPGSGALVTPVTPAPTGPSPPAPGPSGGPVGDLVVDVAGKVRRPGIVVLDPGSRVVDALEAAGGARPGVRLSGLNLARPLVDGEQILVGVRPVPGIAASAAAEPGGSGAPAALVNLNTATSTELDELPGVGPVTAQAILDWRAENGGFTSVDQLLDVSGIGEATLADLAPLVTIG
jgi:competence protein ComEA